jgi:DNA primase
VAGRIPQSFIDDLIARSDIVEVINARVPLKRKGREYMACCPFHNEKTPSFTVSESKQFYYCFGCHAKGNVIGFLMDYEHMSYVEAIESLAADHNLEVPHEGGQALTKTDDKQPLYDCLTAASAQYQAALKHSKRAISYLKQRGLTGDIAKRYKIGYAPDAWDTVLSTAQGDRKKLDAVHKTGLVIRKDDAKSYDRFRDRIMFPITDQRGRIIGFGGRVLDKGEPKYLNSPESSVFHKGYELYGLYETRQALRKIDRILIVEGYMDVVALAQHGIEYAIASLGTATTTDQIQKAFRTSHEIVYCYDGDNAGKQAAWRALENTLPVLRDGLVARFLFLPEKEDPDSMVRKEGSKAFEKRIDSATPLSDFFFETLKSQFDISTREGRAALTSRANTLIKKMHNSVFKDMLINELTQLSGLSHEDIESRVIDQQTKPVTATRPKAPAKSQLVHNNKTRIAIALLIQNPQLAIAHKVPESFADAITKGLPLLYQVQQIINSNPEITTAALLERFRDSEYENALHSLSMLSTPETENTDALPQEYQHIIQRLYIEDRLEFLGNKHESGQALTTEEQKEYLALSTRHQEDAPE